jgi:hypothetical protein
MVKTSKNGAVHPQIKRALRISYDGLDSEQKSVFLDIAHFFIRWETPEAAKITRILDGLYGRSVIIDTSTLIDKCLITTSHNSLEMHDLLREMAFNIVHAESDFPGERSRLCHPLLMSFKYWRKIRLKLQPLTVFHVFAQKLMCLSRLYVLLFVYSLFMFNRELKKLKACLWTCPCYRERYT